MNTRLVRFLLLLVAVLLGATVLSTLLLLSCAPDRPDPAPAPRSWMVPRDSGHRVAARMRQVRYHVDDDIVLAIEYLKGALQPLPADSLPVFDLPASFDIGVGSARIAVDTASLGRLINRYVFGYRGAPIHDLAVTVADTLLRQRGTLGNVSFSILARASVTPAGEIRLHPVDIEVLGIGAERLLDLLGVELEEVLKVREDLGIHLEGNDFLLDPTRIVPPPRLQGHLTGLALTPGAVVLQFGAPDSLEPYPVDGSDPAAAFMLFQGARLRFGKLTMRDTDLLIVDQDPDDPFDFSLRHYHEQLVAGRHHTTPDDGLVVTMPDLGDTSQ